MYMFMFISMTFRMIYVCLFLRHVFMPDGVVNKTYSSIVFYFELDTFDPFVPGLLLRI